ncbi:hypothetical protein NDU88_000981 [Pleurodeles waltl]|uniref:Uncharacterized protein n=1 Tax=Pleurodeles waltl TaxID=8319 RepID=A0AAV7V6I8_PLEWA|nr:hypothetical protein NDU88_000981 [Pleurodeles waltl]
MPDAASIDVKLSCSVRTLTSRVRFLKQILSGPLLRTKARHCDAEERAPKNPQAQQAFSSFTELQKGERRALKELKHALV